MMEVSGAPVGVLLQRPWLPVSIGDCRLLAKIWFGDSAYHILLTDMTCVWEERMDSAAIQSRAQELNRRLRAPVKAFFSHLCAVVQPCLSGGGERADGEAQISLTRQEDGDISMRLKSELAGLPFYWEFHCTPASVTLVCAQLVRPLLAMSRLLQRQVEQLGGLLARKDAEIQDYRENGATLSRERLQTDVFEEQTYREDFMAKALPVVSSEQQDAHGFDAELQHLYASVVAHGNARKRRLSEERCVEEEDEEEEEEEERPAASEEPDLTPSAGVGSVRTETAESDRGLRPNGQTEATRAKMADRAAVQQSLPVTCSPAERPASKPKKKKVGLFR
ncbi:non-homologous end-joining factor 1 [Seriola aureovittata]|uniref:non-homologous end-joining factor 1 n=1 Tax=Seriola aureovittata TaxID=2871759 RepID=UPI0024BEF092|nr:non-homologous end-joining factor 1 [Seriola aureovittata]XP_056226578.1 non-homologous end-joining factor 1 [Seriola aureovittata]XP_056226579.1 non-homologous end-joining factor 1 [Seriola aureovittata]XP_056226580.1 non-homologous end-joining factor 1 [Seriola aureovittata]